MPNYFVWVGGSTAAPGNYTNALSGYSGGGSASNTWVRAFEYNNPYNWKTDLNGFDGGMGGSPGGPRWSTATRCPGIGDIAVFGEQQLYAQAGYTLPTAKAPCLWGGATATTSGGSVTWRNCGVSGAGQTGATYSSDLNTLVIGTNALRPGTQYPFSYLGTGIVYYDQSAFLDAFANGYTLAGTQWADVDIYSLLVNVVPPVGSSYANQTILADGLKLKVASISTAHQEIFSPTHDLLTCGGTAAAAIMHGKVQIDCLKNLEYIAGACGGATGSQSIVKTTANLLGGAEFVLKGYLKQIYRFGPVVRTYMNAPYSTARKQLTLQGATCGNVEIIADYWNGAIGGVLTVDSYGGFVGEINTDIFSNIGKMIVRSPSTLFSVKLDNLWSRTEVERDLGYSGGTVDNITPNLTIETEPYDISSSGGTPTTPGQMSSGINPIRLSSQYNNNFNRIPQANRISVSSSSPNGITLGFGGSFKANDIKTSNCRILTPNTISTSSVVEIGQLDMTKSVLNFSSNQTFNNWRFGLRDGYNINGGIVFRDEASTIIGSAGVLLWNDQIAVRQNTSTRLGASDMNSKYIPDVSI